MTILGLEQPVGYNHVSTFDPTTAQMVLAAQNNYINALRDEYKQGLADIKEFGKEYGDFTSPIEEDMLNYYNATTGAMNKLFSEAQARGIDLLRSPEGRSLVQQFIAARPYGQMAQWKQNAENAKTFLRVAASRKTQNPEFDRWWWKANYGIDDLSQWGQSNQTRGKVFDVSSIPTFQTLQDLTADTVSSLQPGVLNQRQVHSINPQLKYDPRYTYTGRSQDMIEGVLQDYMPGLASDPNYQFHLERARQKVANNRHAAGDNTRVTDQDAYNQLMNDAVNANRRFIGGLKYDADKFALSDHQYRQQVALKRIDQQLKDNKNHIGWTTRQRAAIAENYKKRIQKYKDTRPTVSKNYGLFQTIPVGADKTSALAFAANVANPEQVAAGLSTKRLPISFIGDDIFLTKKRQYQYYDSVYPDIRKTRLGTIVPGKLEETVQRTAVDSFDKFLKTNHVGGYIPSSDVTVNYTVDGDTDVFDINTHMRVKKSDIISYFTNKEQFIRQGQEMGFVAVLTDGRRVEVDGKNRQKLVWDRIESIDIPVTRSIATPAYGNSQLDEYREKRK